MKVAVLIPDRGDRKPFMNNCLRLMAMQTLKPDHIEIVDDEPLSDEVDITWRYRIGYDRLRNKGFDLIALIENDDWYAPNYLETMVREWIKAEKPDLFGCSYTIYYHLALHKHFTFHHMDRSSAMNSLIKPDLQFEWCVDHEPYTDLHLWKTLRGYIWHEPPIICLGMKHGIGRCGGLNHVDKFFRYKDSYIELSQLVDPESLTFYNSIIQNENITYPSFEGKS